MKEFRNIDLNTIKKNPTILIIGKPGTGKTTLVKRFLNILKNDDLMILSQNKNDYTHKLSYNLPTIEILKEEKERLIVIDNYLTDDDMKNQEFTQVLLNGRYYGITHIITMNYLLNMTYELISNFDYVFLFSDNNIKDIKTLYKCFGGAFKKFKYFNRNFKNFTKNYSAMVISNYGYRNKISDTVFKFPNEITPFCKTKSDLNMSDINKKIGLSNEHLTSVKDIMINYLNSECIVDAVSKTEEFEEDTKNSFIGNNEKIAKLNKNKIELKEFELNKMVNNSHVLIVGKSDTEKTTIEKKIYDKLKNEIDECIVISPTELLKKKYTDFTNVTLHNEYDKSILEDLMYKQTMHYYKQSKRKVLLIFDDCFHNMSPNSDKILFEILFNSRHYNISYILSTSFIIQLLPELRSNLDYTFLLNDNSIDNQNKLYKYYAGVFPSFNTFKNYFNSTTENMGAMVIVNTGARNGIDVFKWSGLKNGTSILNMSKLENNNFCSDDEIIDHLDFNITKVIKPENNLIVKEFDLKKIKKNSHILIIGTRGTGKTTLVKRIYEHFKNNMTGSIVICPTEMFNNDYNNIKDFVYSKYKNEIIEETLNKQSERIKNGCKSELFVVMDDCFINKEKTYRNKCVNELLFNGRHYNITYVLTMQYTLGISPELRGNFDYIFLLADGVVDNVKKLHKYYAGMFPTFKSFQDTFDESTKDRGCMVIENNSSNNINDKVFKLSSVDMNNKIDEEKLSDLVYSPVTPVNEIKFNNPNSIDILPSPFIGKIGVGKSSILKNIYNEFKNKKKNFIVDPINKKELDNNQNTDDLPELIDSPVTTVKESNIFELMESPMTHNKEKDLLELVDSHMKSIKEVKNKIKFKSFNLSDIKPNSSVLIVGKKGTGKSTVVKDIYDTFANKAKDFMVICSNREYLDYKQNTEFYKKMSNFKIFENYNDKLIEKILYVQTERQKRNDTSKIFLVLDDCLTNMIDYTKSPSFRELIYNGRCYNITVVITSQYLLSLPPGLRCNIDYVFFLKEDNIDVHRKMFECYGNMFKRFKLFRDAFIEMTKDNGKMVIVNNSNKEITDVVFKYERKTDFIDNYIYH